jgi:hypothetical protein
MRLLAVAGLATRTALSPALAVFGNRLEVGGEPDVRNRVSTSGSEHREVRVLTGWPDLHHGPVGLPLSDAAGGRLRQAGPFPARGWSPNWALQKVIREAALDTGADIDEISYWRLGFHNTE